VGDGNPIPSKQASFGLAGCAQQSAEDINARRWDIIEKQLRTEHRNKPSGVATTDLNGLRSIVESTQDDVWITFFQSKLWWTRLATSKVKQDSNSKFRRTIQPWSDRSANGRLLVINDLPGKIAQLQGFRGTVCRVQYVDLLRRTLNGTLSPIAIAISEQRASLAQHLTDAIKELHWKDFETLVDLVFRATGWVRVSVLGQQAKAYDLELREPITGDRYVVQVKSRAALSDLLATTTNFSPEDFRRIFFVVHSPEPDLAGAIASPDFPDHIEIVLPQRLGMLALVLAWPSGLRKRYPDIIGDTMYPSVKEVVPREDYALSILFDNGESGILDMKSILDFGVFRRIKDYDKFRQIRVAFDTIEWDCGVDLDPEFVYAKCNLRLSA